MTHHFQPLEEVSSSHSINFHEVSKTLSEHSCYQNQTEDFAMLNLANMMGATLSLMHFSKVSTISSLKKYMTII